jgi:hypothetical protein
MANPKDIYLPFQATGLGGTYMRIRQASTGFYLDHVDGVFRAVPATPNIPLAEVASLPSVYYRSENRTAWITGEYSILGYDVGGNLVCGATMFILNDTEVSQSTLMAYMEFINKVEGGNWELKDIAGQAYWIYYDTDGVTVLRRFKCYDSSGVSSLQNVFKREKV